MIVISVFNDHCLTLPIFSFNQNSLKYKRNKDDFVGIDDRISESLLPQENSHTRLKFKRAEKFKELKTGFQYVTVVLLVSVLPGVAEILRTDDAVSLTMGIC